MLEVCPGTNSSASTDAGSAAGEYTIASPTVDAVMNEFVFDPRVFIRPPYITCPNCAAEEQFGVLMIGWGYTRRCRECWFTERYDLPEIRKKVIYLDQMAISEMMKALNPASPAYERVDPFWRDLFEKLDVLKKFQAIVCPDSATHRAESAVAPDPEALRRMYELLAFGISFNDGPSIRNAQVAEYLARRARS